MNIPKAVCGLTARNPQVINRNEEDFTKERTQDLKKVHRNYDPNLHQVLLLRFACMMNILSSHTMRALAWHVTAGTSSRPCQPSHCDSEVNSDHLSALPPHLWCSLRRHMNTRGH